MSALPRGECCLCHRNLAVRVNGRIREHRRPGDGRLCDGSGKGLPYRHLVP